MTILETRNVAANTFTDAVTKEQKATARTHLKICARLLGAGFSEKDDFIDSLCSYALEMKK